MKYLKLFEDFESGVINIIINGEEFVFTLKTNNKILLMKNDQLYQRLDIKIPDSEELEDGEFFMASDVKKEIIIELENQGFIEKINKFAIAGDKKVFAYTL